jgi:hypothetical protein
MLNLHFTKKNRIHILRFSFTQFYVMQLLNSQFFINIVKHISLNVKDGTIIHLPFSYTFYSSTKVYINHVESKNNISMFWFSTKVYTIHDGSISKDKLTVYYLNFKTNSTHKLWTLYLKLCVFIIYISPKLLTICLL